MKKPTQVPSIPKKLPTAKEVADLIKSSIQGIDGRVHLDTKDLWKISQRCTLRTIFKEEIYKWLRIYGYIVDEDNGVFIELDQNTTRPFRPMLAAKANLNGIRFPVLGSSKLDGVRCLAVAGRAMSRSMLEIPNQAIQQWFAANQTILNGLDGELIVGSPTVPDCYRRTVSAVMSRSGKPDFGYYVFDRWDMLTSPYVTRFESISSVSLHQVSIVPSVMLRTMGELLAYEARLIDEGYEGLILGDPQARYKHGRATTELLKIKRFEDGEAVIIGYQEALHNDNEATRSETGSTKRSSHQANKTGKNMLGAWIVRGLTAFPGVVFQIGTGMEDAYRKTHWVQRDQDVGKIVKFKYFAVGSHDAPRHPVYLGFRDQMDL